MVASLWTLSRQLTYTFQSIAPRSALDQERAMLPLYMACNMSVRASCEHIHTAYTDMKSESRNWPNYKIRMCTQRDYDWKYQKQ